MQLVIEQKKSLSLHVTFQLITILQLRHNLGAPDAKYYVSTASLLLMYD